VAYGKNGLAVSVSNLEGKGIFYYFYNFRDYLLKIFSLETPFICPGGVRGTKACDIVEPEGVPLLIPLFKRR
jgi:hypothetical protein